MNEQPIQPTWLPLPEAATQLGLSVQTLRRRIKAKRISARQLTTPHGPAWQVCLPTGAQPLNSLDYPEVETLSTVDSQPTTQVDDPLQADYPSTTVELIHWLRELQEENRNLAGQLGYAQAQFQAVHEQIALLEAPKEEATSVTVTEVQGAPWWRFWRRSDQ
jgi:hypothetical protein